MSVELRPYRSGDEEAICKLFELVFGRKLSVEFWRWRYVDHPGGGPYAELAWDGDSLVGHYAASAATLTVNGAPWRAALSMTTMIHSDFRGQRLFERLAERLYERMTGDGVRLVLGFPNANSHRGFVKRLAWKSIYEIPVLTLRITDRTLPLPLPHAVEAISSFGEEFDAFWDKIRHSHPLWTWRDKTYLNWRYCRNPMSGYRMACWREGGQILGFCVTKIYNDEVLDVVELVAREDRVAAGLVSWCVAEGRAHTVARIGTWLPLSAPARLQLESMGFAAEGPVTYFGVRGFGDAPIDLADYRNWAYSMGDSDVY
jgi:hypothetical protein